ncbi:3-isopropylmalate/(R)-2-methylmalate dehydratase small subunit [Antricoccus suffuscus]|uniref:3-isopropylmalate dehydratase small subunit n=1 Tax=Antricoccus suffuscus TaxID=1629062 RepID=A0A2T1A0Q2_9ACTN|nr:3-isopropylmalate dehydratase [Antricoccus suffuscus]PRZ42182.1 3-isopropylmalate/(R)-2-methylmalate dehydratase small subunit [Antricoccus suffuscus]
MSTPETLPLHATGRAWVFRGQVTTDDMFPGFAMKLPIPEAAAHVMSDLRPGWAQSVRTGDILVGDTNFGLGSSRPVPLLLRELGIAGLVAERFNSLFLRNCINYGLPALAVPGILDLVKEGGQVDVDVAGATITDLESGRMLKGAVYPDFILEILQRGGLLKQLEEDGFLSASTPD